MGFALAKTLLFLLLPPSGILVLVAAGVLMQQRHRNSGRSLVALGILLLYGLGIPAASDILIKPLESFAPPFSGTAARVDAVVVLGGGVSDLAWVPAPAAPSGASLERLLKGIEIARSLRVPLVVSGGTGEIAGSGAREADAMAETAARLGFPRKSLLVENRSRNTLENAEAVGRLLDGRTVVLATSAYHMKRAAGMFRKSGFTVIPAPTAYLGQSRIPSWTNFIPRADALLVSSTAISEHLSLTWYRLRGTI